MALKIPISITHAPVDVSGLAKLWEKTKGGTVKRQQNTHLALQALIGQLNHLAGQTPQIKFQQAYQFAQRETASKDPLHIFRIQDDIKNARDWRYNILHVPRTAGTGDSYAQKQGNVGVQSAKNKLNATSVAYPDDVFETAMGYARGNAADVEIQEGVSTFNNFSILDICIQDLPIPILDVSLHDVAYGNVSAGHPVIANILEQIRKTFHELRSKNLPVVITWAAQGTTSQPVSTNNKAIVIDTNFLTNVIDGSSTGRTASSPGPSAHVYRAAHGIETQNDGKKVPLKCAVFAKAPASNGTIRLEGPDHITGNRQDLTIGGPGWYTTTNNLYLNSAAQDDDTTTARNKVDILGKVAVAGDKCYVYAMRGWIKYAL